MQKTPHTHDRCIWKNAENYLEIVGVFVQFHQKYPKNPYSGWTKTHPPSEFHGEHVQSFSI